MAQDGDGWVGCLGGVAGWGGGESREVYNWLGRELRWQPEARQ